MMQYSSCWISSNTGVDPGAGKGRGTNSRWLGENTVWPNYFKGGGRIFAVLGFISENFSLDLHIV